MTQPPAAAATKDEKGAAEASTTHTPHLTASTSALFFLPLRLFFLLPVLKPACAPSRPWDEEVQGWPTLSLSATVCNGGVETGTFRQAFQASAVVSMLHTDTRAQTHDFRWSKMQKETVSDEVRWWSKIKPDVQVLNCCCSCVNTSSQQASV